ncbi:leucyl/phenylalanyl-tRNA--protein transferase [Salinisphaera sp. Q1T1-3]|uniref:leucyl/phenylalanyl-tRNA--protein transferase n=1 Tax=Salinisphaera sp. Q1T1-3 TaxID=2321229 RepID=UPI000E761919|nr:leucyl/phenylalanyl-tRNA--protein transferase [Salinisphaera sp. Q1T1-3]RJS94996.1 leucyl/phenylalanyl-tRNA--protein transferase [Salinisphaera sp. Q1T1-3]
MSGLRLYWLDPNQPNGAFPDPRLALNEPNGLLAMGGDLSPERLLRAYDLGIFPWYNPDEAILWWSPDPRTVFPTDGLRLSRRFRRTLAKTDYAVTLDRDFPGVIRQCAALREQTEGTWLGPEMRAAYQQLHDRGHAHSIEVWRDQRLIGGLYGLARGRVFFGESMFSLETDASKIALAWLCRQLDAWGFTLLDGQVGSGHLYRMGAIDLSREKFLGAIAARPAPGAEIGAWRFDIDAPQHESHLGNSRQLQASRGENA